jgi:hypothetical protein
MIAISSRSRRCTLQARRSWLTVHLTYDRIVGPARSIALESKGAHDRRSYYRNGYQHCEEVVQTSPGEFEIKGHAEGPRGGPYRYPVSIAELCRMSNDVPWGG